MKIRNDFVSNSSSSSFVLFGAKLEYDELLELWKKLPGHENDTSVELYKLEDAILHDIFETTLRDEYNKAIYCGESPAKMKEDETLKEFKARIVDNLGKCGIKRDTPDVKFYYGTDYDGDLSFEQ